MERIFPKGRSKILLLKYMIDFVKSYAKLNIRLDKLVLLINLTCPYLVRIQGLVRLP